MPFAVHKVKSMSEKQVSQDAEICHVKSYNISFCFALCEKELRVTVQDSMTFLSTEEVKVNLQQ